MRRNSRFLGAGVLIIFVIVATILVLRHRPRPAPVPQAFAPLVKVKGPDTAPVKIIEYSDFECPSCRTVQELLNTLFKKYPDQIQLTFRHFPLTSHKWSIYVHQAAECMNLQGKFWPYHDKIYNHQLQWSVALTPPTAFLARTARELNANMELFNGCIKDVAVTREIYAEKEAGTQQQVTATPTFLIGTERFVGPKEVKERMENVIRKTLGLVEIPSSKGQNMPSVPDSKTPTNVTFSQKIKNMLNQPLPPMLPKKEGK